MLRSAQLNCNTTEKTQLVDSKSMSKINKKANEHDEKLQLQTMNIFKNIKSFSPTPCAKQQKLKPTVSIASVYPGKENEPQRLWKTQL